MRSRALLTTLFIVLLLTILGGGGCASLFGADFDGLSSGKDAAAAAFADVSIAPTPIDEPEAPSIDGKCREGRKLCASLCVSLRDPRYGCAANTCEPCSIARGLAACDGSTGACAIGSCEAGRGSCNGDIADGCETSLTSDPEHCGACETKCGADKVCGPTGCGTTCGPGLEACGGSCVNKASDEKHCGTCGNACPATANGSSACENRTCTIKCNTGFHLCADGKCTAIGPTSCGATCKTCTAPASATPTCTAQDTCSFKCNPGYEPCVGSPATCCLIAPVCKAKGDSCTGDTQCCTGVCFQLCLCMSVGQSCREDKNCCDGKKCGFYDGSPDKCKP